MVTFWIFKNQLLELNTNKKAADSARAKAAQVLLTAENTVTEIEI